MSCETAIHNVARVTMSTRKLTSSSRPRYDWVSHTIQFKNEAGLVLHTIIMHGLDGEAPLKVELVREE